MKKMKFNILDFSIILLSIIIIAMAIFWDDIRTEFIYKEKTVEYIFKATEITDEMYNTVFDFNKLTFSGSDISAGSISKIKYDESKLELKGAVVVKGREKENGFYISGEYFVVPGKKFIVENSAMVFEIEIISIEIQ